MYQNTVNDNYHRHGGKTRNDYYKSPIYKLKKLNNSVKKILINKYVKKGQSVLELACGKGQDVGKYPKLETYTGIDIVSRLVTEAIFRFRKVQECKHNFYVMDIFNNPIRLNQTFDVVSCQLAIHYAGPNLDIALNNVSVHLKDNGWFIMSIPDNKRIREMINEEHKLVNVDIINSDMYRFSLVDALDNVPEYFLDQKLVIDTAKKYGLEVYENSKFEEYVPKSIFCNVTKEITSIFNAYRIMTFKKEKKI
jgi:mRNA (guanine-N7-)-methyltransferase